MMNKKELVAKVVRHILGGGVVLAEKTKAIRYGGKQLVSVGRYYEAVQNPNHRYAVITTGKRPEAHNTYYHQTAYQAAHDFVSFVGNDIARYGCTYRPGKG